MSPNWVIQECEHCGTKVSGKSRFCPECKTAKGRREMDEDNNRLFKKHGSEYNCEYCKEEQRKKELIKV